MHFTEMSQASDCDYDVVWGEGKSVNRMELKGAFIPSHQMSEGKHTSRQHQVPPAGTAGLHGFGATIIVVDNCSHHLLRAYHVWSFLPKKALSMVLFWVIFPSWEVRTVSSAVQSCFEN